MSSSVCQGLQSCLEPRLVEPLVLRHKLAPPKSNFSPSLPWPRQQDNSHNEEKNNNNNGGWSFIQALANTSHNCKQVTENEKVYVDPLAKRSSSMLSTKSLEMCTESLGSETGSDISESSGDEFSSLSSSETRKFHKILQRSKSTKLNRSATFPPPLSSISGSDSVQVRPHREGGRLVIKAVTVSSCNTYFQAERVDGRLRLCLLKECSLNSDNELARAEEKLNNDEEDADEYENFDDDDDAAGVGDDEVDDHGDYWGQDMGGNSGKVGIGELPRPSRCKECGAGNKGMSNWGPFWVIS